LLNLQRDSTLLIKDTFQLDASQLIEFGRSMKAHFSRGPFLQYLYGSMDAKDEAKTPEKKKPRATSKTTPTVAARHAAKNVKATRDNEIDNILACTTVIFPAKKNSETC
jgi:hypothetical protein